MSETTSPLERAHFFALCGDSLETMTGRIKTAALRPPHKPLIFLGCLGGGAERDRTADLVNAIHALSQLSYGPIVPVGKPAGWAAGASTYAVAGKCARAARAHDRISLPRPCPQRGRQ